MARGIWGTLGIKATDDVRAIRKAYSAKLKAIDVDADPAGFDTLRQAYEQALSHARFMEARRQAADGDSDEDAGEAVYDADIAMDGTGAGAPAPSDCDLIDDGHEAAHDEAPQAAPVNPGVAAFHEIAGFLQARGPDHPLPDETETAFLKARMAVLLDWLRSVPVDEAQDAEYGIAHLLAATIPHSDDLLEGAIDYFGWKQSYANWDKPPSVRAVVERLGSNRLLWQIMQPAHPLHRAYRSLTADKAEPVWARASKDDVRKLLKAGHEQFPGLLGAFNPHRVEEWEGRTGLRQSTQTGIGGFPWGVTALIVVTVIRLLIGIAQTDDSGKDRTPANDRVPLTVQMDTAPDGQAPPLQPAPQGLSEDERFRQSNDRDGDIARALDRLLDVALSVPALKQASPQSYKALEAAWDEARRDGMGGAQFRDEIAWRITDRFDDLARAADAGTLRRYIALRKQMMEKLLKTQPAKCDTLYLMGRNDAFGTELTRQFQLLMTETLLARDGAGEHDGSRTFSIPTDEIRKATVLTDMTEEGFTKAMRNESSRADRCAASIALIDVLLNNDSAKATEVLRHL